jgi:5'-nucleotidase
MRLAALLLAALLAGEPAGTDAAELRRTVTISVVGTNDLHGAVAPGGGKGGLALFAGYLANLRRARAADGGAVLLVDAGDLFQGTLESNLNEGSAVIQAYNALGYDAAAVGNHDFDYGPAGEAAVPRSDRDDPFGALKARAAEARFPFLAANLLEAASGKPVSWPNVKPTAIVEKSGVKIGIVGVSTEATLRTTAAANVRALAVAPLAETIAAAAAALRRDGAQVVVVAAHAGGECREFRDPDDLASCAADQEIMAVARALPGGAVDAIVAGHRHEGIAHRVNGIPVVESYSDGRAFSRVDLTFDRDAGRVSAARLHPPQQIVPGRYEGAPVVAEAALQRLLAPHVERARRLKEERLGPVLEAAFERAYDAESAEGNLIADMMLAAQPQAQVAVTNGGGLRADLPAGPLTYGALYAAQPFDNRFALVEMTGGQLSQAIAGSLSGSAGILLIAGTPVRAFCEGGTLVVKTRFAADEPLLVATSDFLAAGALARVKPARVVEQESTVRDGIAAVLRRRGGRLRPQDFYDPQRPRLVYEGTRPLRCGPPSR